MDRDISNKQVVENAHPGDLGTGIYWFLETSDRYEQAFIPSITRDRARALATIFEGLKEKTFDAFRWVPNHAESIERLVSADCGGQCSSNNDCVDPACRCIKGQCRRR